MSARLLRAACLAVALLLPAAVMAQNAVHGESSEFAVPTLTLVWAVERGASEEATLVVIRTVNVAGAYARIRVDGVDPFSKARALRLPSQSLGAQLDIAIPRARFVDHASTEIFLFRSAEDERADRPALRVFYLGVPDTAPEFADPAKMEAHLTAMVAKTRAR